MHGLLALAPRNWAHAHGRMKSRKKAPQEGVRRCGSAWWAHLRRGSSKVQAGSRFLAQTCGADSGLTLEGGAQDRMRCRCLPRRRGQELLSRFWATTTSCTVHALGLPGIGGGIDRQLGNTCACTQRRRAHGQRLFMRTALHAMPCGHGMRHMETQGLLGMRRG